MTNTETMNIDKNCLIFDESTNQCKLMDCNTTRVCSSKEGQKVMDYKLNKIREIMQGDATPEMQLKYKYWKNKILQHREEPINEPEYDYYGYAHDVKHGNYEGYIAEMKPDEFIDLTGGYEKLPLSPSSIETIYNGLKKGNKYHIGHLELKDYNGMYSEAEVIDHEGRHRAVVAKILGLNKIPVAVIDYPKSTIRGYKPHMILKNNPLMVLPQGWKD